MRSGNCTYQCTFDEALARLYGRPEGSQNPQAYDDDRYELRQLEPETRQLNKIPELFVHKYIMERVPSIVVCNMCDSDVHRNHWDYACKRRARELEMEYQEVRHYGDIYACQMIKAYGARCEICGEIAARYNLDTDMSLCDKHKKSFHLRLKQYRKMVAAAEETYAWAIAGYSDTRLEALELAEKEKEVATLEFMACALKMARG